jgi:hypothetical protein
LAPVTLAVGRRQVDGDARDGADPVEALGAPRSGDDVRALGGQGPCDGETDALSGPGHDGDLLGQSQIHRSSLR